MKQIVVRQIWRGRRSRPRYRIHGAIHIRPTSFHCEKVCIYIYVYEHIVAYMQKNADLGFLFRGTIVAVHCHVVLVVVNDKVIHIADRVVVRSII